MTITRNSCGTLRSQKKALAMEQLLTTGNPSPSFNFLTNACSQVKVSQQLSGCWSRLPSWCQRLRKARWPFWRWRLWVSARPRWSCIYIMYISNMYLFGYDSCSLLGEGALGGNERRCGLAEVRWRPAPLGPCHHQDSAGIAKIFTSQYFIFMRLYMSSRHATHW